MLEAGFCLCCFWAKRCGKHPGGWQPDILPSWPHLLEDKAEIVREDNSWVRWTYIILWSLASVLSSPPSAVLSLRCPQTEKSIRRIFVPLPGTAPSSAPRYGGTCIIIPDPVVALVFLRLQSREGREGGREYNENGGNYSDKRKTSHNRPCSVAVAVLGWATGTGGPEPPETLTSTWQMESRGFGRVDLSLIRMFFLAG